MNELPQRTEAGAVAEIVEQHVKPHVLDLEGPDGEAVRVLVLPSHMKATSIKPYLDEFRDEPERRKGTARFGELTSFIAHANRFHDEHSALFADPNPAAPSLTAVLDYHEKTSLGAPRFGHHRGVYSFPLSDEWKAWTGSNGKTMTQAEFAEFIENHITDVADPARAGETAKALAESIGASFASPSKLLELSRGLSVRVGAKVQNAVNLATGEASMQFSQQHSDDNGAALKVPGGFIVALPVFRNGAPYQIGVRLRYRVRDGGVLWFYEMYRADRVFDHAFREAVDLAATETSLPLYIGTPEA